MQRSRLLNGSLSEYAGSKHSPVRYDDSKTDTEHNKEHYSCRTSPPTLGDSLFTLAAVVMHGVGALADVQTLLHLVDESGHIGVWSVYPSRLSVVVGCKCIAWNSSLSRELLLRYLAGVFIDERIDCVTAAATELPASG